MKHSTTLATTTLLATSLSLLAAFATDAWLQTAYLWQNIGLQKAYNTGIAFGLNLGPYQAGIIIIALVILAVSAVKHTQCSAEQIGYGLIIGGGLANVIDRFIDGKVTDMFKVGSFPIFNVADTCINLGVLLLIVHLFYKKRMKNRE